jgi:hypothetical protein
MLASINGRREPDQTPAVIDEQRPKAGISRSTGLSLSPRTARKYSSRNAPGRLGMTVINLVTFGPVRGA